MNHEPPQSPEAEKGVLSAMLMAPKEVFSLCGNHGVTAESFHIPANQTVFKIVHELWMDGKPIDFVTIATALKSAGELEKVGGFPAVTELSTFLPSAINAEQYIKTVSEKYSLRNLIRICGDYMETAYLPDAHAETLVENLQRESNAMAKVKREPARKIREIVMEIAKEVMDGSDDTGLIKTGVAAIDAHLRLYRSDFLVVPGPTSSGKSALASNIAVSMLQNGRRGAYFPLEMSSKQTLKRAIADVSGHSPEFVRKISLDARFDYSPKVQAIQEEFMEGVQKVANFDFLMFDNITNINGILGTCRALHAVKPLDFIVVDYIQLLKSGSKYATRQLEIADMSRTLKLFAGEMNALVITPSQVNKEGGTREAADLENDANAILSIVVTDDDNREVWIGKQREGQRNVQLPLTWNGSITKFVSNP